METGSDDSVSPECDESSQEIEKSVIAQQPSETVIPNHLTDEKSERCLVDCLLDIDVQLDENEQLIDVITSTEAEAMTAWTLAVPCPKYTPPQVTKKKITKSLDDSAVTYHPHQTVDTKYRNRWRKSYDYDITDYDGWRLCVEPTTYRYIPNNGQYRYAKISSQRSTPTGSSIKKAVNKYITPEQKQLQKEIQRALRKEFEQQEQLEKQKAQSERQKSIIFQEKTKFEIEDSYNSAELQVNSKPNSAPEKYTDNAVMKKAIGVRVHSPVQLPAIDVPLVVRRSSDKYMETFNRRITALDAEMKRDMHVLRRGQYDDVLRSKSEPLRLPHSYMKHNPGTFPTVVEPLSEDMFSVKAAAKHGQATSQNSASNMACRDIPLDKTRYSPPNGEIGKAKTVIRYTIGAKEIENYVTGSSSQPHASVCSGYNEQDYDDSHDGGKGSKNSPLVHSVSREFHISPDDNYGHGSTVDTGKKSGAILLQKSKSKGFSTGNKYPFSSVNKAITIDSQAAKRTQANSFTGVPLGKARHKDKSDRLLTEELINDDLLPGVSGKRLNVTVSHRRPLLN